MPAGIDAGGARVTWLGGRGIVVALGLLAALLPGGAAAACDPAPCQVEGGGYRIALPAGGGDAAPADLPAVMFLHGAGSSGAGMMRVSGMVEPILSRGYALIAPDGLPRPGPYGAGWSFHPDRPEQRDEAVFLARVLDDAAARFGVDPERTLLAGFSIGGSMVAYLACDTPEAFAAYAPVGGNFWRPHPEGCAGPVRMLHTHGWRDTTVPLEGRPLGGGRIYQGDVFQALQIWRQANGCDGMRADAFATDGVFWRRRWDRCAEGTALELALHPGAHGIPPDWAEMALDWFERLEAPPED